MSVYVLGWEFPWLLNNFIFSPWPFLISLTIPDFPGRYEPVAALRQGVAPAWKGHHALPGPCKSKISQALRVKLIFCPQWWHILKKNRLRRPGPPRTPFTKKLFIPALSDAVACRRYCMAVDRLGKIYRRPRESPVCCRAAGNKIK